jgi:hypothetical protein
VHSVLLFKNSPSESGPQEILVINPSNTISRI